MSASSSVPPSSVAPQVICRRNSLESLMNRRGVPPYASCRRYLLSGSVLSILTHLGVQMFSLSWGPAYISVSRSVLAPLHLSILFLSHSFRERCRERNNLPPSDSYTGRGSMDHECQVRLSSQKQKRCWPLEGCSC
jgi:hypothetical protein